jgi:CheY-like chemotaxis protein
MSPELKSRAFETFFTTKSAGHGTVLGLALVDDIVAFHKGHIEVDSSPGQGTTVRVSLPAVPSTSPAPTPDPAQSQVGANRILLIDDDPLVCRTLVRLLGRHLDVSVENSGQAAITRLSEEAFDAVLCDVSMPGMSGPEILRQVAPRLRSRFVFLTGGAITGQDRAFIESCERPVLMKPIAPADLLAAIARVASLHA